MKKTLVFGASLKPSRYSNLAMRRLAEKGIETVAFGMVAGKAHGIEITRNIEEFQGIHTITLYMNPRRQEPFYDQLIALGPERIIFNPGTENPEFASRLRPSGIEALEACTLVMLGTGNY